MGSERTRSSISHRKMSFSPMGDWPPQADRKASVVSMYTKEEVSKGKRIIQVAVAVVYCLFAAGIVFGYAAIKPVLIQEGVYKNQCTKRELRDGTQPCYGQEIRLNLMFTIAAVSTNVAALPIGAILDRYGPRVCGIIGSVFLAIGAALFALAGSFPFDGFIPGYFFLALGGPVCLYFLLPIVQLLPSSIRAYTRSPHWRFRLLIGTVPPFPDFVRCHRRPAQHPQLISHLSYRSCLRLGRSDLHHAGRIVQDCG